MKVSGFPAGGGSTGPPHSKGPFSGEKAAGARARKEALAGATSAGQSGFPGTRRYLRPQALGQSFHSTRKLSSPT